MVRAWRAGYVVLMLDGFDEIASVGWSGSTQKLKEIRSNSMRLVREFIRNTPDGPGVIVSGRSHFFNNGQEMASANSNRH